MFKVKEEEQWQGSPGEKEKKHPGTQRDPANIVSVPGGGWRGKGRAGTTSMSKMSDNKIKMIPMCGWGGGGKEEGWEEEEKKQEEEEERRGEEGEGEARGGREIKEVKEKKEWKDDDKDEEDDKETKETNEERKKQGRLS